MPFAHLMFTPPAAAQAGNAAALADALTSLIATALRKQRDLVALRVEPVPALQWTIGGLPLAAPGPAAVHLQVLVTAGSNSADEMAAFIAQAFALLERSLGPLQATSYIAVQELPAGAWGYGGRTQESRRRERADIAP